MFYFFAVRIKKKSYKHGSGNVFFPSYKHFLYSSDNMLPIENPCCDVDARHALMRKEIIFKCSCNEI